MVEIPAALEKTASERGLGPCEHRFRRRPGVPAVLGLVALAFLVAMFDVTALPVVALTGWIVWLALQRRRRESGLYLFDGGFAVVRPLSGSTVATWDQVENIRKEEMVVRAAFLPVGDFHSYEVRLKGKVLPLTLNATYVGLDRAVSTIRDHVRSVAPMTGLILRRARADEADTLSNLALAAKAHWGYDEAFIEACRAELTFAPADVERRHIVVADVDGVVTGFYSVDGEPPVGELGNLWVRPDEIGTGLGRMLWDDALTTAAAAGFEYLDIDSEPFAEGFYLRMGAERVGEIASGSVPGRVLPQLRVKV